MSRAKEALFMGVGILAGIILSGPAAQAATAAITATLSSQAIYVDGQQVSLTAYAINGNNYVKLRDIGEAVDFNVYWDGKAVQIESSQPYTGEAPASQPSQPAKDSQGVGNGYLANGKPVTEENVLELLRQIEQDWPSGTVWGTHNTPGTYKNEVPSTEAIRLMTSYGVNGYYACGGYAAMVSSLIFGDTANPARRVEDLPQIRPGDVIFFVRNDTGKLWHVTVALESPNGMNSFHYTDGNNGAAVYWPDPQMPYSREVMGCYGTEGKTYRIEAWTRYPESVPFTGGSVNAWGISAP